MRRTPLQGVGNLQRLYGSIDGTNIGKRIISSYPRYSADLWNSNYHPSNFHQVKVEFKNHTISHQIRRANSSIAAQIDENILEQNDASTSAQQPVQLFIPDSVDEIGQMQWEDLTKLIANLRLNGNVNQRAESFEDVFALFNSKQSSLLQELIKSKFDSSEGQLNSSVWPCYINVLAHCKNWEDTMIELHSMASSQERIDVKSSERFTMPNIPVFVLEHAFTMIRNSHHASEACNLLNDNLDSMNLGDATKLHLVLNDLIMNDLQATYLSGMLTSITMRIASRLIRTSEMRTGNDLPISINGQIEALKIIRHLIQSFLPWPFGHIRRHVQKLLNWADCNLSLDHCDVLRMQILGCEPIEDDIRLPWQNIRWTYSAHRSFPTSQNALDLVDRLYSNQRHGAGMQFALQSALHIAIRSRSERQATKLVGKAERLYKSNRISIDFFKSAAFLEELVMTGQKEKAMQLFDIILATNEEVGHSTKVRIWASIIGMLANVEDSPDTAMRILDINDETDVSIQRPPTEILTKPFIYAKVIQQIALRTDSIYADRIDDVWDLMSTRGIEPDLHCLEEYCVALVCLGRTGKALEMLDWWLNKFEGGIPRHGFIYRMMKRMIEQGETQQVYHLYLESISNWQQESDIILLPTLLRAAEEVSIKQRERGYTENHPFIARMLFQGNDSLKGKEILWDGIHAPLRARQIFRQVLFDNYPDLCDLPNPLDDFKVGKRGGLWRNEIRMQRFEEWLSHKLSFDDNGSGQQEQYSTLMRQNINEKQGINDQLQRNYGNNDVQRVMLQCTHDLFENYLRLLPYVEDCAREIGMGSREREKLQIGWDERLIVLSWMRYLDIFPNKSCLCLICTYVQEKIPPVLEGSNLFANRNIKTFQDPYSYSNHSAAGPLHGFLADWIGEENIPTNQDVANYIRYKSLNDN